MILLREAAVHEYIIPCEATSEAVSEMCFKHVISGRLERCYDSGLRPVSGHALAYRQMYLQALEASLYSSDPDPNTLIL